MERAYKYLLKRRATRMQDTLEAMKPTLKNIKECNGGSNAFVLCTAKASPVLARDVVGSV